jgi:beta-phosphoglucomutase-like phosphatase (HAD superfamily)
MIAAVIFDLDGVIVDSEQRWDAARRTLAAAAGRPWPPDATRAMLGMSAPEWEGYMHDVVGLSDAPEAIGTAVVDEMAAGYRSELPLIDGAAGAVRRLGERWPLGVASSSNAEIIDLVLDLAALRGEFEVLVSSEQVGAGKPAPDVYLEAARQLGMASERCAAIEDSTNGLRSAAAAGMAIVAAPNRAYPPDADALALAGATVEGLGELTAAVVERADAARRR